MKICYLIPARYHSTRLPGEPLLKINGISIIKRTYNQVLKVKNKGDIFVVSDDDRIINEVGFEKCIKITRKCINGTERICYALDKLENNYDLIINVQGDEPFIDPCNIDYLVEAHLNHELYKIIDDSIDDNIVCMTLHNILKKNNALNPNIVKLVLSNNNNILYASRSVIPGNKKNNLIDNIYNEHIGIFSFNKNFLKKYIEYQNTTLSQIEDIEWLKILEMGYKIKSFQIPGNHEIGVNTKKDYEYLINKYS